MSSEETGRSLLGQGNGKTSRARGKTCLGNGGKWVCTGEKVGRWDQRARLVWEELGRPNYRCGFYPVALVRPRAGWDLGTGRGGWGAPPARALQRNCQSPGKKTERSWGKHKFCGLTSLKTGMNLYWTCYNMDEPQKHARHKGLHIVWFHLHETSRIGKSIGTESRLVGWGTGTGNDC